VGGFNSPVALSLTAANGGNLPTGLNPSFTPTAVGAPGSGTSILAFAPDGTSTPGQYPLTITASGASVTRTAALTVTVKPPPSFTLRAAAPALSVLVGAQASTQITSTAINGFSSTAALSGGTLPAGVLVAFAPPAIPGVNGKSTVNVETTSSAVPGSYTIPVNATGGGVTASVNITLNVGQLVVTPASAAITVKHGGNVSVSVDTSVTGTYSSSVTLSVTGLPKGVTASFSPATISNAAAGASTLKLTAASSATIGAATITIKAVSDGLTQTVPLSLTVQ
jgi:uncharacterized membrane protein